MIKNINRAKLSILTLLTLTITGCATQPQILVTEKKVETKVTTPTKIEVKESISLEEALQNLFRDDSINKITIEASKKKYKENEILSFTINTKKESGYLYIISINKNEVVFFQPNPNSPLSELQGKHQFPRDFGNGAFEITATKECKECPSEKSSIYALLSKKPIKNIKKMVGNQLLNFIKNFKNYDRGFKIKTNKSNKNKNFFIGKLNLIVE